MTLTDKQQAFVAEYLVDLNRTQAAIRAGYSPKSAADIASQLLGKTHVRDAIAREMAERSKRTGISQDRVIRELARIAFVNPGKVVDLDSGTLISNAADDDLAAISGIKYKKTRIVDNETEEYEIRFYDKLKALDMLCKHLGMYDGKSAETIPEGEKCHGVVMIPAVMARPEPPEYFLPEADADNED